jgi:hypothetical protein
VSANDDEQARIELTQAIEAAREHGRALYEIDKMLMPLTGEESIIKKKLVALPVISGQRITVTTMRCCGSHYKCLSSDLRLSRWEMLPTPHNDVFLGHYEECQREVGIWINREERQELFRQLDDLRESSGLGQLRARRRDINADLEYAQRSIAHLRRMLSHPKGGNKTPQKGGSDQGSLL